MHVTNDGQRLQVTADRKEISAIISALEQVRSIYKADGNHTMAADLDKYVDELLNGEVEL